MPGFVPQVTCGAARARRSRPRGRKRSLHRRRARASGRGPAPTLPLRARPAALPGRRRSCRQARSSPREPRPRWRTCRVTIRLSIEAGARAGMIAPDDTTFAYLEGRPAAPEGAEWEQALDAGASSSPMRAPPRPRGRVDVRPARRITWGTHPSMVPPITGFGARSRQPWRPPTSARRPSAPLSLHGARPGTPIDGHPRRPGLHRLVHERADRGSARGRPGRRGVASTRTCSAMVAPGSAAVKHRPRRKVWTAS